MSDRPDYVALTDTCPCGAHLTIDAHRVHAQERHKDWLDRHTPCRMRASTSTGGERPDRCPIMWAGTAPSHPGENHRCLQNRRYHHDRYCNCECGASLHGVTLAACTSAETPKRCPSCGGRPVSVAPGVLGCDTCDWKRS